MEKKRRPIEKLPDKRKKKKSDLGKWKKIKNIEWIDDNKSFLFNYYIFSIKRSLFNSDLNSKSISNE